MGNKKIDKTLIFNSKVGMHLANMEKLSLSVKAANSDENLEQIKVLAAKIHHLVCTNEKSKQDCMSKAISGVAIIIQTLQNCTDQGVCEHLVKSVTELANNPKRGKDLVALGIIPPLLSCLTRTFNSHTTSQSLLVAIHELLSKLGPKDKKFGTRFRLSGALGVNLSLVRNCSVNSSQLSSYLVVLRIVSANNNEQTAINCQQLGRSGAISCVIRLAASAGKKHPYIIRLTLDILANLARTRANVNRMIGFSGVPIMITIHSEWHSTDVRNKQLSLRKQALNLLKLMTNHKNGRKVLQDVDGLRILYATSFASLGNADLEPLIQLSLHIIRRCVPKQSLPLSNLFSAYHYKLPTDTDSSNRPLEEPSRETDFEDDDEEVDLTEDENAISFVPATDIDPELFLLEDDENPDQLFPGVAIEPESIAVASANPSGTETQANNNDLDDEDDEKDSDEFFSDKVFTRTREDLENSYANFCEEATSWMLKKVRDEASNNGFQRSSGFDWTSESFGSVSKTSNPPPENPNGSFRTLFARNSIPSTTLVSSFSVLNNDDIVVNEEFEVISNLPVNKSQDRSNGGNKNKINRCQSEMGTAKTQGKKRNIPTGNSLSSTSQTSMGNSSSTSFSSSSFLTRSLPKLPINSHQMALRDRLMRSTKKTLLKSKSTTSCVDGASFGSQLARQTSAMAPVENFNRISLDNSSSSSLNPFMYPGNRSSSNTASNSPRFEREETRPKIESAEYPTPFDSPHKYASIAWKALSAVQFKKIPIPEAYGHLKSNVVEHYKEEKPVIARYKMFEDFERVLFPQSLIQATVYDLEDLLQNGSTAGARAHMNYSTKIPTLMFSSIFECGNLRKVTQVREREYDLVLNTDTNSRAFTQWFYFEVSNMKANVEYRFNIVNLEKPNSQFNFGMQPLIYSVQDMLDSGVGRWQRSGFSIGYYKNQFIRNASVAGGRKGCTYYTLTFSLVFTHTDDIVYVAYHYPFSYSMLQVHLEKLERHAEMSEDIYFRRQNLCNTISGNECPLITITAAVPPQSQTTGNGGSGSIIQSTASGSSIGNSNVANIDDDTLANVYSNMPVVFLSSRVHPGESNSSWVMAGTLNYLLSEEARPLREMYVFKIVPMLNPDGVINGNYRSSLTGQDLNRVWLNPSPELHPTIYHTKGLLHYLSITGRKPFIYCDYHGHSRRKNIFMFGCSNALSWYGPDILKGPNEDQGFKCLPKLLSYSTPSFSLTNCCNTVEKVKESTARVVVWRHLQVLRSYTMESTFSGFDQGPYKGTQIGTRELQEMGAKFVESLTKIRLLLGDSKCPRIPTIPLFASLYSTPSMPTDRSNFMMQLSEENLVDAVNNEVLSADQNGVVNDSNSHLLSHVLIHPDSRRGMGSSDEIGVRESVFLGNYSLRVLKFGISLQSHHNSRVNSSHHHHNTINTNRVSLSRERLTRKNSSQIKLESDLERLKFALRKPSPSSGNSDDDESPTSVQSFQTNNNNKRTVEKTVIIEKHITDAASNSSIYPASLNRENEPKTFIKAYASYPHLANSGTAGSTHRTYANGVFAGTKSRNQSGQTEGLITKLNYEEAVSPEYSSPIPPAIRYNSAQAASASRPSGSQCYTNGIAVKSTFKYTTNSNSTAVSKTVVHSASGATENKAKVVSESSQIVPANAKAKSYGVEDVVKVPIKSQSTNL
ncbi:cytosolic carboxypeptidase 1-like isoform X4 [Convolutriloba macropyga]|uniref:cytosolic carboxypeptidase 1-like isoform X4 n=1 Tax=Convolutriloba macropyga TaxID=536237 RepID=UPI003F522F3D